MVVVDESERTELSLTWYPTDGGNKFDGAACKCRQSKHKCIPLDGQLMNADDDDDDAGGLLSDSIHSPVKLFTRTDSAMNVGDPYMLPPPSVRYVTVDKCGCT